METSKLNICMLLDGPYDSGMPARPEVLGIYGECLPALGHRVTWIMPARGKLKAVQKEHFSEVPIYLIPQCTRSPFPMKILAKLLYLWRGAKLASRIVCEEKCNIVQARNGLFEGLIAIYLKRKYRIPLVFQYSFPFAEADLKMYESGAGKSVYLMAMLQRLMIPFIMRRADLILPISNRMEQQLADAGIPPAKMMSLPLGVNTDVFSPANSGAEIRERYGLCNSAVVIYLGTLDKLRSMEILIRALAEVKQRKDGLKLLIVGEGNDRANLEDLTRNLGLNGEVVFTGQMPYHQVPNIISAADVAVCPVPPLDIYKVSSPAKLFEYMAASKPVVANEEIPEHKEVLEQSGGGILVPFTPEAFANAIVELLNDPERAAEMGRRGREWVTNNRSYEILARRVEERYFELLK